jgi:hypothetical protein
MQDDRGKKQAKNQLQFIVENNTMQYESSMSNALNACLTHVLTRVQFKP